MSDSMQGRRSGYYRRVDGSTRMWDGARWTDHYASPDQAIGSEVDQPQPQPQQPRTTSPAVTLDAAAADALVGHDRLEGAVAVPTAGSAPVRVEPIVPPPATSGTSVVSRPDPAPPVAPPSPVPVGRRRPRGVGEVVITVITVLFALGGLGDVNAAIAVGLVIQVLTIVLIVLTARRRALKWLWLLIPVLVLRGPVGIGAVTYAAPGVSIAFGWITLLAFALLLIAPAIARRR